VEPAELSENAVDREVLRILYRAAGPMTLPRGKTVMKMNEKQQNPRHDRP